MSYKTFKEITDLPDDIVTMIYEFIPKKPSKDFLKCFGDSCTCFENIDPIMYICDHLFFLQKRFKLNWDKYKGTDVVFIDDNTLDTNYMEDVD